MITLITRAFIILGVFFSKNLFVYLEVIAISDLLLIVARLRLHRLNRFSKDFTDCCVT